MRSTPTRELTILYILLYIRAYTYYTHYAQEPVLTMPFPMHESAFKRESPTTRLLPKTAYNYYI
jgi:hypothetical protein